MAVKVEYDIDLICSMIVEGNTFTQIAENVGISRPSLFNFLDRPDNSARAQESCQLSAHIFTDKAREVLESAKKGTMVDVMLARELSQHYMKMASFRNRSIYGETPASAPAQQELLPQETLLRLAERINSNAI